jgi:hypothetical protein
MLDKDHIDIVSQVLTQYLKIGVEHVEQFTSNISPMMTSFDNQILSIKNGLKIDKYLESNFEAFVETLKHLSSQENIDLYNDAHQLSIFDINASLSVFRVRFRSIHEIHTESLKHALDVGISNWSTFSKNMNTESHYDFVNIKRETNSYIRDYEIKINKQLKFIEDFHENIYSLRQIKDYVTLGQENEAQSLRIKELTKNINDLFSENSKVINYFINTDINEIHGLNKINAIKDSILQEFERVYDKGVEKNKLGFSLADQYLHNNNLENLTAKDFLDKKMVTPIKESIAFNNPISGKPELLIFPDNSAITINELGHSKRIFSLDKAEGLLLKIVNDDIKYTLRKYPKLATEFLKVLKDDENKGNRIYSLLNTVVNNYSILKSIGVDILSEIKSISKAKKTKILDSALELLDDKLNAKVNDHKLYKYAHSIASNKYKHLYDLDSYQIINAIYELKIESSVLQDGIGKKIAAYKTPQQFNQGLKALLNSFSDFTSELVRDKAAKCKADIICEEDNVLIIKIENFKQSNLMGSNSWCISRDSHYFKSYVGDYNHQYFVYDFNKDATDPYSMIGITLTHEIECHAAHIKNDVSIEYQDETLNPIIEKVLKYDSGWYKEAIKLRKNSLTI